MTMHTGRLNGKLVLGLVISALTLAGCGSSDSDDDDESDAAAQFPKGAIMLAADDLTRSAKEAFIQAESGDVIVFPEGRFMMGDVLTFDADSDGDGTSVSNITMMGYGRDKTILDFSDSVGTDGILVQNGKDITIRDIGIYEAPNNGIKYTDTDGIHVKSVATVWEGELNADNGAYGLYPVESQNILIEDSYVRGSADAGIYVGQSSNIVVRRNVSEENVAGIEIENSMEADVYDNEANKNTGGILIFDLPIGNGLYGSGVRVFDNDVEDNNADNFANQSDNPAGVHIVPPGTGIILLSTLDVEIYNNELSNNETMAVAVSSYYIAEENLSYMNPEYKAVLDDGWQPVPRNISIHDNEFSKNSTAPRGDLITDLIAGYQELHGDFPNIFYDGIGELLANSGQMPNTAGSPFAPEDEVCAADNSGASYGQVTGTDSINENFDSEGNSKTQLFFEKSQDKILKCDTPLARLEPATATINGKAYGCGSDETGDASAASCSL